MAGRGEELLLPNHLLLLSPFIMQTMELPIPGWISIDKPNRNSLRSDSERKKIYHLVNWDKAYKPKKVVGYVIETVLGDGSKISIQQD